MREKLLAALAYVSDLPIANMYTPDQTLLLSNNYNAIDLNPKYSPTINMDASSAAEFEFGPNV